MVSLRRLLSLPPPVAILSTSYNQMHKESEFPVTLALSPVKEVCLREGPGVSVEGQGRSCCQEPGALGLQEAWLCSLVLAKSPPLPKPRCPSLSCERALRELQGDSDLAVGESLKLWLGRSGLDTRRDFLRGGWWFSKGLVGFMLELHSPSGESFPATSLLFSWCLTSLKILEPILHPDVSWGWVYQDGS